MHRCLRQGSSDTDELTYKSGFTKINYPFDGTSSDTASLRSSTGTPESVLCTTIEEIPKRVPSRPIPSVLDREAIADRCRIGIGGHGNSVFVEGHGNGVKYRPKRKN